MNQSFIKNKLFKLSLAAICIASSSFVIADDAGKKVYDEACGVCHTAGIAGAPKLGDSAAWTARIATGKDALYTIALKGKGAMPAKGGRADLSDDAVKAAVDYMISQAQAK